MKYTLEEVQYYGYRLQINTFFTVIINTLAGYLVIKCSAPIMGVYKYYILSTLIFAFLMDFHLSFIWGIFPLYPYPGGCPTGITKYFGPFWGAAVQFGIFHFTLTFCGLSLFFALVYQYLSITRNSHFLQTFRGGIAIGFFSFIYPFPSFIFFLLNYGHPEFMEYLKIKDPELIEFVVAANCDGQVGGSNLTITYLAVCFLQIFFVIISGSIMVIKIIIKLSKEKHLMSPTTLKLRQQYCRVLFIQMCFPVIFITFPVLFLISMVFLNVKNIDAYTQMCFQFMSLHSVANALTILFVIKSYRQVLHRWFTYLFLPRNNKFYTSSKNNTVFALTSRIKQ